MKKVTAIIFEYLPFELRRTHPSGTVGFSTENSVTCTSKTTG